VLTDRGVVDLSADPSLPTTMVDFVALGRAGLDAAAAVTAAADAPVGGEVRLLAPIRPRNNIMAIGKNYHEHAKEFSDSGFDNSEVAVIPDHPIVFTKATTSIVGPGDGISLRSDPSGTTDYEGELGVVIGPGGQGLTKAEAWNHVYGYTVINDVTARSVQKQHIQFFIGKSGATFCPMGPAIVTADEIPDITEVWVRTKVNGELRQEQQISDLIFDIPTVIEAISSSVLLEPGDVIATGTPVGVGIGFDPPRFLAPGDSVEVAIDGVGTLANPVVA
jgi:2-keto-4-pentenoate hydratase/2-oxohepta-3-ene-1,7-dioic acid hydratase in catechol pathway